MAATPARYRRHGRSDLRWIVPPSGFPPDHGGTPEHLLEVVAVRITTVGTPQATAAEELRLECMVPADDATQEKHAASMRRARGA